MLGENCSEATPAPEGSGMSFIQQSGTPREDLARVEPESFCRDLPFWKISAELLSSCGGQAGGKNSSMGGKSSDSDSGSGSESSVADSQLESFAGPEIPQEKPSSLHSQENSSVTKKAQVNLEPTSFRESETNLPFKGNQKTNEPASNEYVNNEQPVRKKKVLRSLRDFLYEPIP